MKNLKKFTAIALATTMTIGSTVTVFAEGEDDATTPTTPSSEVSSEGTGSYEGGEIQYPAISVTLPTIATGTYDYVADPNGLIEATKGDDGSAAKDSNSTYTGSTGIFFLTSQTEDGKKTYTENSQAFEVENESAQDVDITVKLEQKTPGDSIIKYADSAAFGDADKENKLYLAITDGAQTDPKTAALAADKAAVITAKVDGVADNFEAGYNTNSQKYEYTKKAEDDLGDWNSCSFNMTGALNKAATWGDNVTFPEIKVTWSFAEHTDSYLSTSTITSASNSVTVTLPDGVSVSKIELFKAGATTPVVMSAGSHYTKTNNTYVFTANMVTNWKNGNLKFTFSDNKAETIAIQ